MRQAIVTKYLGPTDSRGSRVKAFCDAGSITVSWDHTLNSTKNHTRAMEELCKKLGWNPADFVGGGMPPNTPYAYVFVSRI